MSEKKYTKKEGYLSIEELLIANAKKQREFIDSLKKDEMLDDLETVTSIESDIKLQKIKTDVAKQHFIEKLKTSSLGEEIKQNPSRVHFIKTPWYIKLKITIKRIFTKF